MDRIEASTVIHRPPEEIFDFLVDFTRYARHSKYIDDVTQYGDGGPMTEYALTFSWWRLTYTVRSRVTDIDEPRSIDWRLIRDFRANGRWTIEVLDPTDRPADVRWACRVTLRVDYDPDSVSRDTIDLPRFVSVDWVVQRALGVVHGEAERVVESIVADLEGEPRPIELSIDHTSDRR